MPIFEIIKTKNARHFLYAYFIGGDTQWTEVRMITVHRNETLNGPPLNTGRHSHAAAIYNGSIVICGGTEIDGYRLNSCERLQGSDLWTGAWQTFAALPIEVDNGCLMTVSNVVSVSKRKLFQMSLFSSTTAAVQ